MIRTLEEAMSWGSNLNPLEIGVLASAVLFSCVAATFAFEWMVTWRHGR